MTRGNQPAQVPRVFKAPAVSACMRIVGLLGGCVLCVNALARELTTTPTAVSQHLNVLRDNELVVANQQ